MTAAECMERSYQVILADASVDEVVRRLKAPDADPIPVCEGDRLIGMVGYRDVASGVVAGVHRGDPVRARDVMAPDLVYCLETTEVEEAVALMRDRQMRVLPVVSADRRMVGVLSLASVSGSEASPGAGGPTVGSAC
jgi:CBS domain-containing protein